MKTFFMRNENHEVFGEPVQYTPIIFICGDVAHRLALHRIASNAPNKYRPWVISHPILGAKICRVTAYYKGCPVSSAGISIKDARNAAMFNLDQLCARIGSTKFNEVVQC